MKTIIKNLKEGDVFEYHNEIYVLNQKGIMDSHCVNSSMSTNFLLNPNLILHNSTEVNQLFKIGDYVRLGNDIPFQVLSENGLKNVNSKPYRFANENEIELAKLHRSYKNNKGIKWESVLKLWMSLS